MLIRLRLADQVFDVGHADVEIMGRLVFEPEIARMADTHSAIMVSAVRVQRQPNARTQPVVFQVVPDFGNAGCE